MKILTTIVIGMITQGVFAAGISIDPAAGIDGKPDVTIAFSIDRSVVLSELSLGQPTALTPRSLMLATVSFDEEAVHLFYAPYIGGESDNE